MTFGNRNQGRITGERRSFFRLDNWVERISLTEIGNFEAQACSQKKDADFAFIMLNLKYLGNIPEGIAHCN